jgi:hypothetical protein
MVHVVGIAELIVGLKHPAPVTVVHVPGISMLNYSNNQMDQMTKIKNFFWKQTST